MAPSGCAPSILPHHYTLDSRPPSLAGDLRILETSAAFDVALRDHPSCEWWSSHGHVGVIPRRRHEARAHRGGDWPAPMVMAGRVSRVLICWLLSSMRTAIIVRASSHGNRDGAKIIRSSNQPRSRRGRRRPAPGLRAGHRDRRAEAARGSTPSSLFPERPAPTRGRRCVGARRRPPADRRTHRSRRRRTAPARPARMIREV